jgi:hypothetical protein
MGGTESDELRAAATVTVDAAAGLVERANAPPWSGLR